MTDRSGQELPAPGDAPPGGDAGTTQAARLARSHVELRRVAGIAAAGAASSEVFAAVARAASAVIDGRTTSLVRFDGDGPSLVLAVQNGSLLAGTRIAVGRRSVAAIVQQTGRTARIDDYSDLPGAAAWVQELGLRSAVGAPVRVDGRLWGMLTASSTEAALPPDTEDNLTQFAGIIEAAIAGAQARDGLRALADEQAALLRVARLVARGADQAELFGAVASEASGLIDGEPTTLVRFDEPRVYTVVASHRGPAPVGARVEIAPEDEGVIAEILRTRRPARLDDYGSRRGRVHARDDYGVLSSVGVPIIVNDRIWGVLGATDDRRLPESAEARLAQFAGLVAAAVANAQARAELRTLADEQSALRRVAELVARGTSLEEVFRAVTTEASALLDHLPAALLRYESEQLAVVVAAANSPVPVGLELSLHAGTGTGEVLRTGRPQRTRSFDRTGLADVARELAVAASVAVPVIVEGRVWGSLSTTTSGPEIPEGTESRLIQFAELAAAAIATAENRAKLTASRARVVATADETRRRLQRDVHDGAQQRLVHTIIALKLARDALAAEEPVAALVDEALRNAERANRELRDVVRGILPASLTRGGLRLGVEALAADLPVPVDVRVATRRLPARIETTAYFIVAEALTNVVKHAEAGAATVDVATDGDSLVIAVRDDGVGGADPALGTGLTGLSDRIEAARGTLTITSSAGLGTTLLVRLPVDQEPASGDGGPHRRRPESARDS